MTPGPSLCGMCPGHPLSEQACGALHEEAQCGPWPVACGPCPAMASSKDIREGHGRQGRGGRCGTRAGAEQQAQSLRPRRLQQPGRELPTPQWAVCSLWSRFVPSVLIPTLTHPTTPTVHFLLLSARRRLPLLYL